MGDHERSSPLFFLEKYLGDDDEMNADDDDDDVS